MIAALIAVHRGASEYIIKLFLDHVPRVFAALQQARESAQAAANGFYGQLRVALSDGRCEFPFVVFNQPAAQPGYASQWETEMVALMHNDLPS